LHVSKSKSHNGDDKGWLLRGRFARPVQWWDRPCGTPGDWLLEKITEVHDATLKNDPTPKI